MATSRPRYMISVNNRMNEEIEKFKEENKFTTKSEATQELIRLGLEALRREKEKKGSK